MIWKMITVTLKVMIRKKNINLLCTAKFLSFGQNKKGLQMSCGKRHWNVIDKYNDMINDDGKDNYMKKKKIVGHS